MLLLLMIKISAELPAILQEIAPKNYKIRLFNEIPVNILCGAVFSKYIDEIPKVVLMMVEPSPHSLELT